MEALLALLRWIDLGSWLRPTPATPVSGGPEWAKTTDMFPGLPPLP